MHRDKKGGWRTTAAARILSVVLGASMVLSLMPCEGLAWALAGEEVAVQADDAAGALTDELEIEEVPDVDEGLAEDKDALAEGEDAEEALTEDQGNDLVVEEEDAVKAIVEEPAAAKGDNVPEWAVDDGADAPALTAQAALPARYDLRGDGFVTPVKAQTPWGSCWAFGGIAAAESSILSSMGVTYADTVRAGSPLDLSERHLSWFAPHPITEADDPEQVGEGTYTLFDGNHTYDAGGSSIFVTTLFSQGVGPVPESLFPYRGVDENGESHTLADLIEADSEYAVLAFFANMTGNTVEGYRVVMQNAADKAGITYDQQIQNMLKLMRTNYAAFIPCYANFEDWTIPATDANGRSNRIRPYSQVFKDGNVLPEYLETDGKGDKVPSAASMTAMKQELANGHGVAIRYKSDTSLPGQAGDNRYINTDTWAQYTFEVEGPDHGVCVVGYDDSYPASNFTHTVYKQEAGSWVEDTAASAMTTPPGNGAWIIKNSWGSETDVMTDDLGNEVGRGTYGVRDASGKATGYYYLSYYDKSIKVPETMTFSSNLVGPTGTLGIFQHDYMAATDGVYTMNDASTVMSSANVFDLKTEHGDQVLKSVATRTSGLNQRVTFAIYQMNDGAKDPTDGELLYRTSTNFEYAGFHRLDLDVPITMSAGHKYSVVSTVSELNGTGRTYTVSANKGVSQEFVNWYNKLKGKVVLFMYDKAVVNKGESFLYKDGKWVDWSEYVPTIPLDSGSPQGSPGECYIDQYPIDNFSIKLYTVLAEHAHAFTYSASGDTITATCGGAGACDVTEGLALTIAAPADLTYDGRAKAATIVGGYSTTAFPGGHAIRYYRGGEQVKASDVVGAGDYVATLTAGGATASVSFAIERAPLTSMAKVSARTYAGKAISPTPAVRSGDTALAAGTDFSYSYKSNAAPGTATVTATGKGNYRGTVSASFKIGLARPARPATTAYPSKGEVVASWGAVKGAKSYQLQWRRAGGAWQTRSAKSLRHTVTGLKAGALCEFRVRAVAGSVTSAWSEPFRRWMRASADVKAAPGRAQGSVTATWGADKAATGGYKVFVYSKKGGELLATRAAKAGATSATVGGLRSGRTYYVRVRPYRVESGTTYTGVISGYRAAKAK